MYQWVFKDFLFLEMEERSKNNIETVDRDEIDLINFFLYYK